MGEWMPGVCVSPCRQRAGKGLPEALRRVDGLPVGLGVILGGLFPPAEAEDWASAEHRQGHQRAPVSQENVLGERSGCCRQKGSCN